MFCFRHTVTGPSGRRSRGSRPAALCAAEPEASGWKVRPIRRACGGSHTKQRTVPSKRTKVLRRLAQATGGLSQSQRTVHTEAEAEGALALVWHGSFCFGDGWRER